MICNLFDYPFFKDSISTIKETSYDDANDKYLVSSEKKAIDFDNVKTLYCEDKKIKAVRSNDALVPIQNSSMMFIEFKNTEINNTLRTELVQKSRGSIDIASDILNIEYSSLKQDTDYILVYSYKKNEERINKEKAKAKAKEEHVVQQCKEFDFFATTSFSYHDSEYVAFGLNKILSSFYNRIRTYSVEEFNKKIDKLL